VLIQTNPYGSFMPTYRLRLLAALFWASIALLRADTAGETGVGADAENSEARFELKLGAFLVSDVGVKLRLSARQGQVGTGLDFADDLGGERSLQVVRADARWRFARRHTLSAASYDLDLRGERRLAFDVTFGDETYSLGTTVQSRVRTQFHNFSYGYRFYDGPRHAFTGVLGAHVVGFDTSLSATGLVRQQRFSTTAPLPSLGLEWRTRWNERLETRAAVQYFNLSADEQKYSGRFVDVVVAVEYRLWGQGGLGLGLNRFDLDADFRSGPLLLSTRYDYSGALAYAFVRF
jgi:hypothetical protein